MGRFFSIVVFFPVIFVLVILVSFARYNSQAIVEMQEIMLRTSANSANDAAVKEAQIISEADINGQIIINPERVWEEYKRTFLRSMNLFSDINMDRFEAYCPATVIAVNDGYFLRTKTLDENKEIVVRFSQKIPFARMVQDGSNYIVADTMDGKFIYGYKLGGDLPDATVMWGDQEPVFSKKGGVHDISAIAYELMKAMDYSIEMENRAFSKNIWDKKRFYVPKELIDTVYYDAVTFKGLSILNLIQNFDMKGNKPIDYFTVSNTQLISSTSYLCFERGGIGYYKPIKPEPGDENYSGFKAIVKTK